MNIPEEADQVVSTLQELRKNLECSICLELLSDPHSTKCNHQFCGSCIKEAITKRKANRTFWCPLCKNVVTKRSLTPNPQLAEIVSAVRHLHEAVRQDIGTTGTPPPLPLRFQKSELPTTEQTTGSNMKTGHNKRNTRQATRGGVNANTQVNIYVDPEESAGNNNNAQQLIITNTNASSGFPSPHPSKSKPNRIHHSAVRRATRTSRRRQHDVNNQQTNQQLVDYLDNTSRDHLTNKQYADVDVDRQANEDENAEQNINNRNEEENRKNGTVFKPKSKGTAVTGGDSSTHTPHIINKVTAVKNDSGSVSTSDTDQSVSLLDSLNPKEIPPANLTNILNDEEISRHESSVEKSVDKCSKTHNLEHLINYGTLDQSASNRSDVISSKHRRARHAIKELDNDDSFCDEIGGLLVGNGGASSSKDKYDFCDESQGNDFELSMHERIKGRKRKRATENPKPKRRRNKGKVVVAVIKNTVKDKKDKSFPKDIGEIEKITEDDETGANLNEINDVVKERIYAKNGKTAVLDGGIVVDEKDQDIARKEDCAISSGDVLMGNLPDKESVIKAHLEEVEKKRNFEQEQNYDGKDKLQQDKIPSEQNNLEIGNQVNIEEECTQTKAKLVRTDTINNNHLSTSQQTMGFSFEKGSSKDTFSDVQDINLTDGIEIPEYHSQPSPHSDSVVKQLSGIQTPLMESSSPLMSSSEEVVPASVSTPETQSIINSLLSENIGKKRNILTPDDTKDGYVTDGVKRCDVESKISPVYPVISVSTSKMCQQISVQDSPMDRVDGQKIPKLDRADEVEKIKVNKHKITSSQELLPIKSKLIPKMSFEQQSECGGESATVDDDKQHFVNSVTQDSRKDDKQCVLSEEKLHVDIEKNLVTQSVHIKDTVFNESTCDDSSSMSSKTQDENSKGVEVVFRKEIIDGNVELFLESRLCQTTGANSSHGLANSTCDTSSITSQTRTKLIDQAKGQVGTRKADENNMYEIIPTGGEQSKSSYETESPSSMSLLEPLQFLHDDDVKADRQLPSCPSNLLSDVKESSITNIEDIKEKIDSCSSKMKKTQ